MLKVRGFFNLNFPHVAADPHRLRQRRGNPFPVAQKIFRAARSAHGGD
jgi:hypothetical protein